MKLRIVHQNQENRDGDERLVKKEKVEMEQFDPAPITAYDPMLVSVSNLRLKLVGFT